MSNKILFIDESGTHNFRKIDPYYPVFVLAGCYMDNDYYINYANSLIDKFKLDFFGNKNVILHTRKIVRNQEEFEILKGTKIRQKFYNELNSLIRKLNFKIISCVIDLKRHNMKYKEPKDPYFYSLHIILERFVYTLSEENAYGEIIAESRNSHLDKLLIFHFERLKRKGTQYLSPKEIKKRIKKFDLCPRNKNINGLQIADLVASPIGRYILGKNIKEDFRIIRHKFRTNKNGKYLGWGLIIRP